MKTKKEQLGLFSIVWIGFTFIAGITFTASFNQIVLSQNKDANGNYEGIGLHIIWLFIIEGFIAFMCAWAFAKLVKFHPQANGGGSQYVRTGFGKFWGLLMGFLNYSVIPVIGMALIVTMIRANFGPAEGLESFWLVGQNQNGEYGKWGSWGNLYLDLIAFALYIFAATIIFFGIKKYKYVGLIIGYMTWGITLLLMIFGLTAGFMQLSTGNPFDAYKDQKLTVDGFTNAFATCFFAFCGIETFISTGKNIKNRGKNMPIAIIIIMIATTCFYIIFSVITMFAIGGHFTGNPNTQLFPKDNFLSTFGPALIIICTILMRFNSSLQITLFGGATLEPLSAQGFISPIFKKENKENVPVAGVFATMGLFVICAIMFLFIPDIIEGATNSPSPLNYGTIASCASILLISIYGVIIPVAIVQGIKKNIKVQIWEYIAWTITILFLGFILINYLKGLVLVFTKPYNSDGTLKVQAIISSIFQIIYFLGVIVWAIAQYFLYYKPKMAKLDPKSQRAKEIMEYEKLFRLLTDEEIQEIRLQEKKDSEEYKQYKLELKEQKQKAIAK